MPSQLDTFQTLADPTRRRIVEALRHGEQQVNELVARAGIHQSGVSRHLRILHDAGFVSMRPQRQRRLYSLKPEPFRALDSGWPSTATSGKNASTDWKRHSKRNASDRKPLTRSETHD